MTPTKTAPNDSTKTKKRGKRGGRKGSRSGKVKKKKAGGGGKATPPVPEEIKSEIALKYLRQWSTDRDSWMFKKKLQFWLIKNIYNKEKIGKADFKILLQYLEGLQGSHRARLTQEAEEIVKKFTSSKDDKTKDSTLDETKDRKQCKRAQRIIKHLS
ncbi:PREDICTED: uncharacterized protein C7orf50 homolog [Amphimedon queenslandica]|uniref:WKF domain-containing protein n=1 Tax=Amphimedon queenslandica TaxID=400682 RepID=A0A1X7VTF6_AMPQE|nr:PREDICTED: uncharacterized protein C7orf50 homolog [Amphimedon queenslandica]|eukprot:XP_003382775.1 PREDICTED: uncharacterized protein C7orf50 homolog [Amphimedon queenslandica]